jgi:hypothetical protein
LARQPIRIRPAYIEEEFKTTLDNGVKIKGKLDRVEEVGGNFKVIDYKTGRQSETAKPFESKAKPGTKYWRQAMMYSMLVNDTFEDARNVEFEFHYPEIEKIIFPFKAEENVPFVNWLGEIWANTMELKFNRACEKPGCNYCNLDLIG